MDSKLRTASIILLLVIGFAAIYGGWMLIVDPSGQKLQIPLNLLEKTPFNNYMIPGIVLFVVIGIFSLLTVVLTIIKIKYYTWLIILQGCFLIGWLTLELLFNKDFFSPVLHYPLYAIGILLLIIGYAERKYKAE